jgi:hypothetical protein
LLTNGIDTGHHSQNEKFCLEGNAFLECRPEFLERLFETCDLVVYATQDVLS